MIKTKYYRYHCSISGLITVSSQVLLIQYEEANVSILKSDTLQEK